uniref:MYO2 n=1 Tax=Cryptococcus gattii TaxID=552467 RepID=F6KJR8_CRYGA|nr:MYO2 [Cryptococcus gattii]
MTVSHDSDPNTIETLKFPLSTLQSATTDPTSIQTTTPSPGQDCLPVLRNPPAMETAEDLANLSNLNEPSVLHAMATRYMQHYPYTYSGIVLLSMNPFTPLNIYETAFVKLYAGQKKGEREPHVFAIAEEALDSMRRGDGGGGVDPTGAGDQTIIVSGERPPDSGAGKTVAAKYILRYFASAHYDSTQSTIVGEDGMSEVEKQILASNPIMEAFGNAKTIRNDNSSRFGKYIEACNITFSVLTYLLERSRLTYQPASERNYHIFYQLLAGAPSKERKDLSLSTTPRDFGYLAGGGPTSTSIPGVDDSKEFAITQSALSTVGISIERQWHIFRLLAALLHLGNIKISQIRTDAALADDDSALNIATDLLGIPLSDFKKWIIKKQLTTRNEKIVTSLGSTQALVVRDSVAKFLYNSLFHWLVGVVNDSLAGNNEDSCAVKFIGVLDIVNNYGFEHFTKNSFEQFCINWANEKLQQEFYAHVFKLEQEEYVREQISWKFIEFADNQACIDIIEGKMGVLALLDEESRLPGGSDTSFATKLHQELVQPWQKKVFKKPRFQQGAFTITHYAHEVTYDVEGFVEKNRDSVPEEHLSLLQSSTNGFLCEVLAFALKSSEAPSQQSFKTPLVVSKRVTPRKHTLGSMFKNSLTSLMDTINNTNVHYIRCIKPNEAKKAWELDSHQVLSQLRACGVLETIRISCDGYPSRWEYAQFAERSGTKMSILNNSFLESLRSRRQYELATTIQKYIRRRLAYKHYRQLKSGAIVIQNWWRGILSRKELVELKKLKVTLWIQSAARGHLSRKRYIQEKIIVVGLQTVARGHLARKKANEMRELTAAVTLQCLFRSCAARHEYQTQVKRIVVLQSQWRRKLAVRELASLKIEAKSAIKLKEISYQLENKVVELTQTLQKRVSENKELMSRVAALESETAVLNQRNNELLIGRQELEQKLSIALAESSNYDTLVAQKEEMESELRRKTDKDVEQREEIRLLTAQLDAALCSIEETKASLNLANNQSVEDKATIDQLRSELSHVREKLSRTNTLNALTKGNRSREGPPSPSAGQVFRHFENTIGLGAAPDQVPLARRRNRRHSMIAGSLFAGDGSHDANQALKLNPRSASTIYTQDITPHSRDSQGLPLLPSLTNTSDEITRLLEDEVSLDDDVLQGLIYQLKIPNPSLHAPPTAKDVLFPAHLISLVSNEMWKRHMRSESERFLAVVMSAVQRHVVEFKGEDIIVPGIFWLSNIQEILSFISFAEDEESKGYVPGYDFPNGQDSDWRGYIRLLGVVKHDLDSLEYNIYHTFMLEIKKKLSKMVVPALIESQSLPGFITSEGSGVFSKMLGGIGGAQQPAAKMDDILNLLNKVWKCLKIYYMEESVTHQVMTELLKLIGQLSFNDLLMRRNFSSWKRAMQIQYNVTRIEEWCKAHDMPEGLLQLEHLLQATKLLQLKKATLNDIDILFDVCWILSPAQVQKLISQYHTADYEAPLNAEILRAVAARVKPEDKNDQLLLAPETDDVGPYQLPPPREIMNLETYVPAWLNIPTVRRLAALVA